MAAKLGGSKAVTVVIEDLCEAADTFYLDFMEDAVKKALALCLGAPDYAALQEVSPPHACQQRHTPAP